VPTRLPGSPGNERRPPGRPCLVGRGGPTRRDRDDRKFRLMGNGPWFLPVRHCPGMGPDGRRRSLARRLSSPIRLSCRHAGASSDGPAQPIVRAASSRSAAGRAPGRAAGGGSARPSSFCQLTSVRQMPHYFPRDLGWGILACPHCGRPAVLAGALNSLAGRYLALFVRGWGFDDGFSWRRPGAGRPRRR
jgi:hypothetical protein